MKGKHTSFNDGDPLMTNPEIKNISTENQSPRKKKKKLKENINTTPEIVEILCDNSISQENQSADAGASSNLDIAIKSKQRKHFEKEREQDVGDFQQGKEHFSTEEILICHEESPGSKKKREKNKLKQEPVNDNQEYLEVVFTDELIKKKREKHKVKPEPVNDNQEHLEAVLTDVPVKKKSKKRKYELESSDLLQEIFIKQEKGKVKHEFMKQEISESTKDLYNGTLPGELIKGIKIKKGTNDASSSLDAVPDTKSRKKKRKKDQIENDVSVGDIGSNGVCDIELKKKKRKKSSGNDPSKNGIEETANSLTVDNTSVKNIKKEKKDRAEDTDITHKKKKRKKEKLLGSSSLVEEDSEKKVKEELELRKRTKRGKRRSKSGNSLQFGIKNLGVSTKDVELKKPGVRNKNDRRNKTDNFKHQQMIKDRRSKKIKGKRMNRDLKNGSNFKSDKNVPIKFADLQLSKQVSTMEEDQNFSDTKISFRFTTHPVVKDYVPRKLLMINGLSKQLNVDNIDLKIPEIIFEGSSINQIPGYGSEAC